MKNDVFHFGFYVDTLKRIKKSAVFVILLSLIYSSITGITVLLSYTSSLSDEQFFQIEIISLFDMAPMSKFLAVFAAPILTILAFLYLVKRNESDFFEALPIKRSAMAISGLVAVLTVFVTAVIGAALVFLIITIPCIGNCYTIDFLNVALELLAVIIAAIIGSSTTLIAFSMAGNLGSLVITTPALLIIPRTLMGCFTGLLSMLNHLLVKNGIIPFFNSQLNLYYSFVLNDFKARESAWNYVYSLILSIVLIFVSIILFDRRGSEWATQKYVGNIPRHIIAVLVSLIPMALAIQCLFDFENVGFFGLVLIVIAVVVFLLFEKEILTKKEQKREIFFAFTSLLVIVLVYTASAIVVDKVAKSYSPNAEDIEYVSIIFDEGEDEWLSDLYDKHRSYSQYVSMRTETIQLSDLEVKEIISGAIKNGADDEASDKTAVVAKIKTKTGTKYRKVYITMDDYVKIDNALNKNQHYNDIWLDISEGAKYPQAYYGGMCMYADTIGDVLNIMEEEIRKIGLDIYRQGGYEVCSIGYTIYYRGEKYKISIPVYDYMTETIEKLDNGRKIVAEKEISEFRSVLRSTIDSDSISYIGISCYAGDNYYYVSDEFTDFNYNDFYSDINDIISTDSRDEYSNSISISIRKKGILKGADYYYTFAIRDDVDMSELESFFVKYGYNNTMYE